MSKEYKVVGIQIVPKRDSHNKSIVTHVAWNGFSNCIKIFEKLIQPTYKEVNPRTFNVVGIMKVDKTNEEVSVDMDVSSDERMSKGIMQQFYSLVRPVH